MVFTSGGFNKELLDVMEKEQMRVGASLLHTVNVWMREDGAAFDRLIITSDQSMNISDAASEGPAESGRAPATANQKPNLTPAKPPISR